MNARGCVLAAHGGLIEVRLPCAAVGAGVRIEGARGCIFGAITSLRGSSAVVAAHDDIEGVKTGDPVCEDPCALRMPLGTGLLGRSIDGRGRPLDGARELRGPLRPLAVRAPGPGERAAIAAPFWTGIRAVDSLLTLGRGARIGVFGAPGAGKSSLLHTLMRGARADAVVVGLIGERGREAEEWMRAAPRHAAIICATSDRSAAERVRAAKAAMAQAHALRARGLHVLLILDSLARYAAALREILAASGESTGRGGYPPGVFSELARYVEIAGNTQNGSVTLVATVLSDGDERDPVSDCARSLLDGHIELSSALARAGCFPAIDVPASTSRTMDAVATPEHRHVARTVREAIALLARSADARALGLVPTEPALIRATAAEEALAFFLRQDGHAADPRQTLSRLAALADTLE